MGDLANLRGDTEMGCCSCLGFLLEPIKSVRSFHGVPNQFSLTDGNEDGDGFLFAGDPLEGHMRLIKSRPVCRLTPVKETRVLILDKVSMLMWMTNLILTVSFFIGLCQFISMPTDVNFSFVSTNCRDFPIHIWSLF